MILYDARCAETSLAMARVRLRVTTTLKGYHYEKTASHLRNHVLHFK